MDVVDGLFDAKEEAKIDALYARLQTADYDGLRQALRERRDDLPEISPYAAIHLAGVYALLRIPLGEEVIAHFVKGEVYAAGAVFARFARHEVNAKDGQRLLSTLEARLQSLAEEKVLVYADRKDADQLSAELVETLFALGGKETQSHLRSMLPSLGVAGRRQVYGVLSRPEVRIFERERWWEALKASYCRNPGDGAALDLMRVFDEAKTSAAYPLPENRHAKKESPPPNYFLP